MPKLGHTTRAAEACGFDVAFNGSPTVTVRYTNMYDELGRVIRVAGRYEDIGPDDIIDYTYDHLDHLTHSLETRGAGYDRAEETEDYDTLGDLVAYTLEQRRPGYDSTTKYLYRDLSAERPARDRDHQLSPARPTRPTSSRTTRPIGSSRRSSRAARRRRTRTMTTTRARSRSTPTTARSSASSRYDDQSRELSEVWGGSDPQAQHQQTTYVWSGDRLGSVTFMQGTPLATVEVETPRYRCDP